MKSEFHPKGCELYAPLLCLPLTFLPFSSMCVLKLRYVWNPHCYFCYCYCYFVIVVFYELLFFLELFQRIHYNLEIKKGTCDN